MNKELKVVNLLHKWMLMALVLTMLSRRTPSTLVIIETMAISLDNLVVHKVEEDDESVQEQSDPGATYHITTNSSNLASKNDYNDKEKLVIGKLHQESFPSLSKTNKSLQLIHLDVPPSVFFLVITLLIKGVDVLVLPVGFILLIFLILQHVMLQRLLSCYGITVPIVDNISKSGIYKPKVYTTVVALPNHFQKPSSIRQALQLPHRKMAMEVEYSILVRSVSWGFQPSIYDNSLFHSWKNGHLVLFYTHSLCDSALTCWFALKTLGFISYFLGFEAFRDSSGLYLNQAKYISNLLDKKNMVHAKPSSTPMALGRNLLLKTMLFSDDTLYRRPSVLSNT
ncbi:hypothetical protein AAG906_021362 [Vitis piasezkii]